MPQRVQFHQNKMYFEHHDNGVKIKPIHTTAYKIQQLQQLPFKEKTYD